MPMTQTRRRFLTTLSLTGAASLFRVPPSQAAEGPLETTTVRLMRHPVICIAPQYVAEELLRAEGFTDIRYIEASQPGTSEAVARDEIDFDLATPWALATGIDAGQPITLLAGVHVGCYELFGSNDLRGIADLKGKSVGVQAAGPTRIGAPVPAGRSRRARPRQGHSLGHRPGAQAVRAFRREQDRGVSGLPAGTPASALAADRPRDDEYRGRPTLVPVFLLHADRQPRLHPQISDCDQTRAARHPQSRRPLRHRPAARSTAVSSLAMTTPYRRSASFHMTNGASTTPRIRCGSMPCACAMWAS